MIESLLNVFRGDTSVLQLQDAILGTVSGLIAMLLGYRLYRIIAVYFGLILGSQVAVILCARYLPDYPLLYFFLGLLGAGLVGAVFYYVSIFLLGAFLGVTVTHLLSWAWLGSQGIDTQEAFQGLVISYVIAGITAGGLALAFRRPFLIIITSLGGASIAVSSTAMAAAGPLWAWNMTTLGWILAAATFIILSVIGIVVQWQTADAPIELAAKPASKKSKEKKADEKEDE